MIKHVEESLDGCAISDVYTNYVYSNLENWYAYLLPYSSSVNIIDVRQNLVSIDNPPSPSGGTPFQRHTKNKS